MPPSRPRGPPPRPAPTAPGRTARSRTARGTPRGTTRRPSPPSRRISCPCQRGADLVANEVLPRLRVALAVQPVAHVRAASAAAKSAVKPSVSSRLAPEIVMHVLGHEPGDHAERHRADPAHVDPRHRLAPPGLAHEGDDRGQRQDGFEPFAQQDQQRAEEGGGGRETLAGERLLRAFEQRVRRAACGSRRPRPGRRRCRCAKPSFRARLRCAAAHRRCRGCFRPARSLRGRPRSPPGARLRAPRA